MSTGPANRRWVEECAAAEKSARTDVPKRLPRRLSLQLVQRGASRRAHPTHSSCRESVVASVWTRMVWRRSGCDCQVPNLPPLVLSLTAVRLSSGDVGAGPLSTRPVESLDASRRRVDMVRRANGAPVTGAASRTTRLGSLARIATPPAAVGPTVRRLRAASRRPGCGGRGAVEGRCRDAVAGAVLGRDGQGRCWDAMGRGDGRDAMGRGDGRDAMGRGDGREHRQQRRPAAGRGLTPGGVP
ncbi:hypothetical protein FB559_3124 [Actinoallomurus bryophytorum]|uniref:Uncharacterized protein n=1 Tax=Actinoallomurus bryophytorum TaxID=1490222 RepID=A0A543CKA6_9ACTN|nr:hypothetical protein FB559_3124 [Actinoallomurus bryophytorum]